MSVMSDSYKAGHFLMYPEAKSMTAYGEFREPMLGMKTGGQQDNRFVVRARSLAGLKEHLDASSKLINMC